MATLSYCDYVDFLQPQDAKACTLQEGYETSGYIFNRDDIDFASIVRGWTGSEGTIPSTVVTNLVMKADKKGVEIKQLKQAFSNTTVSLATGDYKNSFTQQVSFNIYDHSPEVAKMVNALANGTYVIILRQKSGAVNEENTFRVFGLNNGLTATAIDQDNYSDTVANGWSIQMQEENATDSEVFYLTGAVDASTQVMAKPNLADTETALAGMVTKVS